MPDEAPPVWSTVLRWIRQGELPELDLGGRKAGYRVRAEDLEAWERARVRDASAGPRAEAPSNSDLTPQAASFG